MSVESDSSHDFNDPFRCPACHKFNRNHPSLADMCRELQSARAEIAALNAKVKELEESDEMWNKSGTSADLPDTTWD